MSNETEDRGYSLNEDSPEWRLIHEAGSMKMVGLVIPPEWFNHIQFENGKPHMNAIMILADVFGWYQPIRIEDEETGQATYRKRFKKDKLQRTYGQYEKRFSMTKRQARYAIDYLVSQKLITKELRNLEINGKQYANVMYLEPCIDRIKAITYPHMSDPSDIHDTPPSDIDDTGYDDTCQTNTGISVTGGSLYTEEGEPATQGAGAPAPSHSHPNQPVQAKQRGLNGMPKPKEKEPASKHPAVKVWRKAYKKFHDKWRNPNQGQIDAIADAVSDLDKWEDVLEAWGMQGNNLWNVTGQLDWYRDGIPDYAKPNGGNNGRPKAAQRGTGRTRGAPNGKRRRATDPPESVKEYYREHARQQS